jgi:BlaI family transcriptional regulator, penicillinase repressor
MPRFPSPQPTGVELQILRILWELSSATARQIHERIAAERETNYSTTVKMLSVMLDKGLIRRDDSVRPQVFRAILTQSKAQRSMLRDLVHRVYDGSTARLVLQALQAERASAEELAQIRQLLDDLEGEKT